MTNDKDFIDPSKLDLSKLPWLPLDSTAAFPEKPGIYFAIDSQDVIQYIGLSVNVQARWRSHHRYKQLKAIGGVRIALLAVEDESLLSPIESALIAWFKPPLNVVGLSPEDAGKRIAHTLKAAPRKNRHDVGLSDEEAELIREIAASEGRPFAEILGELMRLGLSVKIDAAIKTITFRNAYRQDQRPASMPEDSIDKLLKLTEGDYQ